jgi:hypothetical protein
MSHLTIIRQNFDNWDISQRDPTIRSEQNLFGEQLEWVLKPLENYGSWRTQSPP